MLCLVSGNVQVYHIDRWGSVCDDEWDEREAQVVCRHLGYSGQAKPTFSSTYGKTLGNNIVYANKEERSKPKILCFVSNRVYIKAYHFLICC